jgi:STIP1 family protein 1
MRNPILTPDGNSYDAQVLKEHCERMGYYDPITRHQFDPNTLIVNKNIQEGINFFIET